MTTSSPMRIPSLSLLRAFLRPAQAPCTQIRSESNWMPREKFASITRLTKLHRRQKEALRQEKHASQTRANEMQPPSFIISSDALLTETHIPASPPPSTPISSTNTTSSLPYGISRTVTRSHSLPIYETSKSGGNLHLTTIRRCNGDLPLLREHLLAALNLQPSYLDKKGRKKENIMVNPLTKQIIVRGWRKAELKRWCEMVGF